MKGCRYLVFWSGRSKIETGMYIVLSHSDEYNIYIYIYKRSALLLPFRTQQSCAIVGVSVLPV